MKKFLFGLCLIALAVAAWPASAFSSIASEERQGQQILEAVNSGSRSCSELSRDNFEVVGDYVMGRMLGSTQAHGQMDALMDRMMGARANQQMHVTMGERFARCGRGSLPSGFGSMMGAIGMMGGSGTTPGSGGMMGGLNASTQGGDGDNDFGTAGWVMVAMMALLLLIAGVVVWLLMPLRMRSSGAPLDVLKARYARGEIDAEDYDRRRRALGGTT